MNVFLVITVILLPAKFKCFNCKYLFRLLSLMANSRLFAALIVSMLGDASSICNCLSHKHYLIAGRAYRPKLHIYSI